MITQKRLRELFNYDAKTGSLTHKRNVSQVKIGDEVGCIHSSGYRICSVDDKKYRVHRLIWVLVNGYAPDFIDHINGVRSDNRIENLRNVTVKENMRNMSLGS